MDNIEYERIFTQQIVSLGERLGSIEKVLGCITDREAAVQVAFAKLEKKYHWMVNLVCRVRTLVITVTCNLTAFPLLY